MIGAGRRRIRWPSGAVRGAAAVVLSAGGLLVGVGSASAATTVTPDSVTIVSDPGVTLSVPADGRLRGDHVAAEVTGVAFASHTGTGGNARQAAAGQRLVVFGLEGAHLGVTRDADFKVIPPVTGTLVVDGQRSVLPTPDSDDGSTPVFYRASVPAGAREVSVELAASGLAQSFSLTGRARVGAQPAVLYRDRVSWQPTDQVNGEQDVATPDPADALAGAILPIRVHSVYLSWFGPDSPADTPTSMDEAWLVVNASSQDDTLIGTRYLHYLTGLTAGQVTLTLPGGQPIASQLFNPDTGESGVVVFDGVYAFAVPADLTSATLTVAPGALRVTVAWSGSTPQNIAARGQASFPVTFSPVYQPPPPQAVTPDAQQAALTPTVTGGGSSGVPVVPIAAALALALGGLAALYARNRRHALAAPAGLALPPDRTFEPDAAPTWPAPAVPAPTGANGAGPRPDAPPFVEHRGGEPSRSEREQVEPPPVGPPASAVPCLATVPAGTPEAPTECLYVSVLGGFSVTGWPDGQAPTASAVELAAYLTLHPDRARSAEDLRDPLSAGRAKALTADTIRTYANTLRRVLGADRVPDAARRGYSIVGATSDWQQFLEHRAAAPADAPPAVAAAGLVAALALVRGGPYAGLPRSGYGWVATELLISEAEVAVTQAAQRLADLALTAGDWPLATWAAERGLTVDPVSEDLNAAALRSAAQAGKPDQLAQTWRDVVRRYSAAEEDVPARITAMNTQLKQTM